MLNLPSQYSMSMMQWYWWLTSMMQSQFCPSERDMEKVLKNKQWTASHLHTKCCINVLRMRMHMKINSGEYSFVLIILELPGDPGLPASFYNYCGFWWTGRHSPSSPSNFFKQYDWIWFGILFDLESGDLSGLSSSHLSLPSKVPSSLLQA